MAATAVLPSQDFFSPSLQRHRRKQLFAFCPPRPKRKATQAPDRSRQSSPPFLPFEPPTSKPDRAPHRSKVADALPMAERRRKGLISDYACRKKADLLNTKHLRAEDFSDGKGTEGEGKETLGHVESKQQLLGVVRILQRPETEEAARALLERFEWNGQGRALFPDKNMESCSVQVMSFEKVEDCRTEQLLLCGVSDDGNERSDAFECNKEDDVPKNTARISHLLPCMMLDECWAGPGYVNSPPPTCLPLPSFLSAQLRSCSSDSHPMHSKRMLGSNSGHLSQKGVISPCALTQHDGVDVSFATRDLQRILNLNCC